MCFILDWLFTIILRFFSSGNHSLLLYWTGVDLSICRCINFKKVFFADSGGGLDWDFIRKSIDFVLSIHGLCTEYVVLTPFDCFKLNSKNNVGWNFSVILMYTVSEMNQMNHKKIVYQGPLTKHPLTFWQKTAIGP